MKVWRMRRRKRKEKQQPENKILQQKQAFHCINEVTQFAIDSNSSSLLGLL
jgi:hypothetical protein